MKSIYKKSLGVLTLACASIGMFSQSSLCLKDVSDNLFLNGGLAPRSVTSADFNGDGKMDIATANYNSGNISVKLGLGTGYFNTATNYASSNNPISINNADFNNDGKTDLVVTDWGSNISLYLGNGDGTFLPAIVSSGYSSMAYVGIADFNNDGKLDLVAATYYWLVVYTGDGTGHFTFATNINAGKNPSYLAVGDLNADARPDIVVSSAMDSLYVFLGNGTTSFGLPSSTYNLGFGAATKGVAIGKFDNNSSNDIALVLDSSNAVAVFLNTGSGTFGAPSTYPTSNAPISITVADFNGDGKSDIATDGSMTSVLLNNGSSFAANVDYAGTSSSCLISPDLNNDGKADLISPSTGANNCHVLLNNGSAVFVNYTQYNTISYPNWEVVNDFNNDGKSDMVVAGQSSTSVTVLLGAGNGVFNAGTDILIGYNVNGIASADFNNDGKADLVTANKNSNNISILLGNGTGTFGAPYTYTTSSYYATTVRAGDLNNDNKIDLVVGCQNGEVITYLGNGNGTFAAPFFKSSASTNSYQNGFKLIDLNADNKLDLVSLNNSSNKIDVYLGDGTGNFGTNTSYSVAPSPAAVAIADLNGDGKLDFVTGNGANTKSISVVLSNGSGYNVAVNYSMGSYSNIADICIADFNGDSKLDIAGCFGSIYVLTGVGDGTFNPYNKFNVPNYLYSMTPIDVNADSKIDLIGCSMGNSNMVVIINSSAPTILANASTNPICKGNSVTLSGGGADTYVWTGGVTDGVATTPTTTTVYTVTGTTNAGCQNKAVITVTVNPLPTLTITPSSTLVCYGNNEILTASGASTYTWTGGATNGVPFTPYGSQSFDVTGTDGNGCINSGSIYITVDQPFVYASTTSNAVCAGGAVTLTGQGAVTYTWTNGITNGVSFTPSSTQTYTISGTDYYNCTVSNTIQIVVNPLPNVVANTSNAVICLGGTTKVYGSGASNYTWYPSVTDNSSFSPTATQNYTVYGVDANNCSNTDTITIHVNPLPVVTFASLGFASPLCSSAGPQTLSGGSPAGGSYSGTGVVSNTTIFFPSLPAGTYTLTYTYTDNNSCINSATDTVSIITCSTGMSSVSGNEMSVEVYPNPSSGTITISSAFNMQAIEIDNALGEILLTKNAQSNMEQINLNELPNGLYYIKIKSTSNNYLKKIQIQK